MGWASGSQLAEDVWTLFAQHLPEDKKQEIARKLVRMFESEDCDTMSEAEELMKAAYPKGRRR